MRRAALPLALAVGVPLLVAGTLWARCGLRGCPDVARLRSYQPGGASRLLDRGGRVFAELRPVEGETVQLRSVPRHVRDAFIAVEDRRFYTHGGVDWRRVIGAALANLRAGGVREGSSTITMQLARNVFPDHLPASERTFTRKLLEVRVASDIESEFTKDEILELYLSHIYFGNGARGIEAASRHYFGVPVSRVTVAQGAMLAGLPKAPTHYDPRRHPDAARERRDLVLRLMEEQEVIPAAEATAARAKPLGVVRRRPPAGADRLVAPWFVEEVRRLLEDELGERLYAESLQITTTLDLGLQQAAEQELGRQLAALEGRAPGVQGAVIALEPSTGNVLAWVGGRDFAESRFDRVRRAHRQVGSAFKPFVYAAALRDGHVLSERLADEPISIALSGGRMWAPRNFDQRFEGAVSLRDALVFSKNVPTVNLGQDVGLDEVEDLAEDSGITAEMDRTPALPLGTVAVSPLELAAAYTPFANLGRASTPRLVTAIRGADGDEVREDEAPETHEVLDPGVAYLVTHVLQDAVARGTGTAVRAAGFEAPVAGKTGTTNAATDAWFVGFTPDLVGVVWIGHDEPRSLGKDATGGRLAAPVWGRFMARAGRPATDWTRPDAVVERWVDPDTGHVMGDGCRPGGGVAYLELFLRGDEPDEECPGRGDVRVAERRGWEGDGDRILPDLWPDEIGGRSEAAPAPEYEEAERPRRGGPKAKGQWKEDRQERAKARAGKGRGHKKKNKKRD
jgi:1A family penicillin-binding protein